MHARPRHPESQRPTQHTTTASIVSRHDTGMMSVSTYCFPHRLHSAPGKLRPRLRLRRAIACEVGPHVDGVVNAALVPAALVAQHITARRAHVHRFNVALSGPPYASQISLVRSPLLASAASNMADTSEPLYTIAAGGPETGKHALRRSMVQVDAATVDCVVCQNCVHRCLDYTHRVPGTVSDRSPAT